ncbi:MAG TPA: hypothetical protein VGN65_08370, partial [Casimicrobiaceae bacterium]
MASCHFVIVSSRVKRGACFADSGFLVALGLLFFVLFFGAWAFATLGGYVSRTFLADPLTMLNDGWDLL